jgi:hypothetical protein
MKSFVAGLSSLVKKYSFVAADGITDRNTVDGSLVGRAHDKPKYSTTSTLPTETMTPSGVAISSGIPLPAGSSTAPPVTDDSSGVNAPGVAPGDAKESGRIERAIYWAKNNYPTVGVFALIAFTVVVYGAHA